MGVPPLPRLELDLRWGTPSPHWDNRRSTWYAAVGMPLAFTQEDFLVVISFTCYYIKQLNSYAPGKLVKQNQYRKQFTTVRSRMPNQWECNQRKLLFALTNATCHIVDSFGIGPNHAISEGKELTAVRLQRNCWCVQGWWNFDEHDNLSSNHSTWKMTKKFKFDQECFGKNTYWRVKNVQIAFEFVINVSLDENRKFIP